MLYTALLQRVYRAILGPPAAWPPGTAPGGLVLIADGIAGLDFCGTSLQYAVAWAGLPYEVRLVHWGHGFGRWYRDLTDTDRHREQAAGMVEAVCAFREQRPGCPVFLVGKSGGSGLVVRALEQLPEASVESAVLLASALSPRYDLSGALRAVRREIVSYYSPLDFVLLGAGTSLFGTIDRRHGPTGGLLGFTRPEAADPVAYARLRQVCWRPAMARVGHLGGHVGPDTPWFLSRYVIPRLQVVDYPMGNSAPRSSAAPTASIS
jgi:pimeloyl-ACP methyl ester carboxylesterase